MPIARCVFLFTGLALYFFAATAIANPEKSPSLCAVEHPSDGDIDWECIRVHWGKTPHKLFGEWWQDVLRFNRIDQRHMLSGTYLKVPKKFEDIENFTPMPATYPSADNDAKFILIDLSEQYLGAYEYGQLVFSFPVATGTTENCTPSGKFRITAYDRQHRSSLYFIEKTTIKYPMHYALKFFTNSKGVEFWIHGRDLPGYPASHGCIGLYDEEMQKKYYKSPRKPIFEDARILYEWAIEPRIDDGTLHVMKDGPRVEIVGQAPLGDCK